MSTVARIQQSADYSRFELNGFNRALRRNKQLEESMMNHGFLNHKPLVVRQAGEKLTIVEGHHRFVTAMSLGLPVSYVVDNTAAKPWQMEDGVIPWKPKDFLHGFCAEGRPEYLALEAFMKDSGLPLAVCLGLLTNGVPYAGAETRKAFRRGDWRRGNMTRAADIIVSISKAISCYDKRVGRHTQCLQAIAKLVALDEFDPNVMVIQVFRHPYHLRAEPDADRYLEMLEKVYNYRNRNKVQLVALAKLAAYKASVSA